MTLGKTNITALKEGAIVTEIEDYNWIQMQSGVYGNFKKVIYKNGYLAAIISDGTIVYSNDGEVWNKTKLAYESCTLNDIDWDGEQFILAGGTNGVGMIVTTKDFESFTEVESFADYREYLFVYPYDGQYIIGARESRANTYPYVLFTDLTESGTVFSTLSSQNFGTLSFAKSTSGILVFNKYNNLYTLSTVFGNAVNTTFDSHSDGKDWSMNIFECKDTLYAIGLTKTTSYEIDKVTSSNEKVCVCTGQNFAFVDGVYYNECQIFINNHEMLIVKKAESIADKTLDDLIEIVPEMKMNAITKAFGQLYIFGDQGLILKSSVEVKNEETISVQTLSAKQALANSKTYTDAKIEGLEAAIATLEERIAAIEKAEE